MAAANPAGNQGVRAEPVDHPGADARTASTAMSSWACPSSQPSTA
ncbi:hypothetical protein [Micromonospora arborensis]